MVRAFLQAVFLLLFLRFAFWAARLITGGRRGAEIPTGSTPERGSTGSGRRRRPGRARQGEIVDVPFTEVPPSESPKRP
jgi:hypothetical protein